MSFAWKSSDYLSILFVVVVVAALQSPHAESSDRVTLMAGLEAIASLANHEDTEDGKAKTTQLKYPQACAGV